MFKDGTGLCLFSNRLEDGELRRLKGAGWSDATDAGPAWSPGGEIRLTGVRAGAGHKHRWQRGDIYRAARRLRLPIAAPQVGTDVP